MVESGRVPKTGKIRASTGKGSGRVPEKVPGKYRRRVQASTEKAPGEYRKVTPISDSTELIDFGAPDQPREIRMALPYLLMRGVD